MGEDDIIKIIDIELSGLARRLAAMNYTLKITDTMKQFLLKKGYDAKMGARPLKRAIQRYIEDSISEEILRKTIKDVIEVDYNVSSNQLLINGKVVDMPEDLNEKIRSFKKYTVIPVLESRYDIKNKTRRRGNRSRRRPLLYRDLYK